MTAVALALPTLELGFFLDDYHQVLLIEGAYDFERPRLNLYDSFLDFPGVPWWTAEDARTGFWRPLSSGLLHLDHYLFGRNPTPWHIHALMWLAALVGVVGLLFRRLPRRIALPALFIFALDESHALTSGVLCNRHVVVTAVPALLGLWLYLRYREDGWSPGRWAAPVVFALSLTFGETTIPVMAYALAYELFARSDHWAKRMRAIAPCAVIAVGYVALYAYFDLGPHGVVYYLNPVDDPARFITGLARHIPALLAGGLAALPASLWLAGPDLQTLLITVGAAAVLLFGLALGYRFRELDPEARRWLLMGSAGSFGALLAVAPPMPSDRQLLVPALGFAVIIATLIDRLLLRFKSSQGIGKWATGLAMAVLALLHLGAAPASRWQAQQGTIDLDRRTEELVAQLEAIVEPISGSSPATRRLLVAYAPDFFTVIYPPVFWDYHHGPGTLSWEPLSTTVVPQTITRTGERSLEIEALEGRYLRATMERMFGLHEGLAPPEGKVESRRSGSTLTVEVLETAPRDPDDPLDDGPATLPKRLKLTFDSSLDDAFRLITWREGRFQELDMPGVGESVTVEPHPGLLGLL